MTTKAKTISPKKLHELKDKLFLSCVSKDETRYNIHNKVHHNKDLKALTSVNGHIAMLDYTNYCKILGEMNKPLDVKTLKFAEHVTYPNLQPIIPSKSKAVKTFNITFEADAFSFIKEKYSSLYIYEDGSYSPKQIKGKQHIVVVDPNFLKLLQGVPLKLYFFAELSPLILTFTSHYELMMDYIVMPKKA